VRIQSVLLMCLALTGCSESSSTRAGLDASTLDAAADLLSDAGNDSQANLEPPLFGERTLPGRWWVGDLHVHASGASNDTGGESTPEALKARALEQGLDFLVLTDHSNSTGSDPSTTEEDPLLFNLGPEFPFWGKAAQLSDAQFLMIDGNEMSPTDDGLGYKSRGHIGCYPRNLQTFDPDVAFIDRPRGVVSGADTIEQARAAGCYVTVNHPMGPTSWVAFDWSSRDYDALEVYNGGAGWDFYDDQSLKAYMCDLALGKDVKLVAGSDNHRVAIDYPGSVTNPPLGYPQVRVWAENLEWQELIAGMDAGHVSVSDNHVAFEFDVYSSTGAWLGFGGDTIDVNSAAWFRVRGSTQGAGAKPRVLTIFEVPSGSCDDTRSAEIGPAPEPRVIVVAQKTVDADNDFDFAFGVTLNAGSAYLATLLPEGDRGSMRFGVGLSNAIRVR